MKRRLKAELLYSGTGDWRNTWNGQHRNDTHANQRRNETHTIKDVFDRELDVIVQLNRTSLTYAVKVIADGTILWREHASMDNKMAVYTGARE